MAGFLGKGDVYIDRDLAKNFIHADKDPDKPKNVMWVY